MDRVILDNYVAVPNRRHGRNYDIMTAEMFTKLFLHVILKSNERNIANIDTVYTTVSVHTDTIETIVFK